MSKKILTDKMKQFIVEVYSTRQDLNIHEKAEIVNKEFNVDFDESSFRKYYNIYKDTVKLNVDSEKELNRLAKAENNVMLQREKVRLQKIDLHKQKREISLKETILEKLQEWHKPKELKLANIKTESKDTIEYVISDLHYKGNEDNNHVKKIFNIIKSDMQNTNAKKYELTFLGDDIEGTAAHKSQLLEVSMTGVQQVINLSKLIGDFIEQLAEIKPFTVYVVAESNHGQVRSLASSRSEFPKDDLGYVFGEWLTKVAPSNVKVNVAGVIETKNEIKFHGHQSFAKNKHSVQQYYGKDKNIEMGHFHKFMVEQIEDNRFVVKYPTAKNKVYEYEIQNAYVNNPPKIVKKEKGINDIIKSFKVIDIK